MKKAHLIIAGIAGSILFAAIIVYLINFFNLQTQMDNVVKGDYRNKGIGVSVHYKAYLLPGTLIYDLNEIGDDNSRIDVFRVFLQFAEKMKDKEFDKVELAFRGETKFVIEGGYYQKLGKEYSFQNVIYTIRTFPENLKTPGGEEAYSGWTGGLLGVLNRQMDDFNDFHDKWYLNKLLEKE